MAKKDPQAEQPAAAEEPRNIHQALADANRRIEAIMKIRQNKMQGFNFRGIDDVYNSLHPVLSECGIMTIPEVLDLKREERHTVKGGVLLYSIVTIRYHLVASDGSSITATVVGEAMDSGDKATNKAMSAAHKYLFLQIFTVPTMPGDVPDADEDENDDEPAPLATDQQRLLIGDFQAAGKVSATLAAWLKRNDATLTQEQASEIISRLQGGES